MRQLQSTNFNLIIVKHRRCRVLLLEMETLYILNMDQDEYYNLSFPTDTKIEIYITKRYTDTYSSVHY